MTRTAAASSTPSAPSPWRRAALWALLVLALTVLVWLLAPWISPAPPRSLVMSTGLPDGAYQRFGLRYQQFLRANGVELVLHPTSGGVENLANLYDGVASVAFVQGGTGLLRLDDEADPASTPLRSLASVAFEPVWIFSAGLDLSKGLGALRGKRVSVGVRGSGNEKVALDLLAIYGVVDGQRQPAGGTTLVREGSTRTAELLQAGEIDAAILIVAAQAPAVQQLLANPHVTLADLEHTEGLARRLPYFQPVVLKRGSVDPARDLPPRDVALLATTANLVVRDDIHPALAYLLLEAASQVHRQASLLNRPDEFPNPRATEFPLSDQAERYFKNGRPFLQNYLPFWVANLVQRLVILLLPLAAILLPLARALPEIIAWRRKRGLYHRYGELKFLEQDVAAHALDATERAEAFAQLDRIENEIIQTRFPLEFTDRVYTLRQHVAFVREQLQHQHAQAQREA